MKFNNVILRLMVGVLATLATACGSTTAVVEPQVIVITATPTATPEVVIDSPEPTEEVQVGRGPNQNRQRFGDLGPAKVGETPAGFQQVGDKFDKVYWEGTT
jgi:hypothetical protein